LSTSASSMRLSCAEPDRFAPISLHLMPPVCAGGRLRTPEPVVVAEWQLAPTGYGLRPILPSLVGRAPSAHESRTTTPAWSQSPFRFPCALGVVFVHKRLVKAPLVCAGSPLRTHQPSQCASCVHQESSPHTEWFAITFRSRSIALERGSGPHPLAFM